METKRFNFENNSGDYWQLFGFFKTKEDRQGTERHLNATEYWLQKKATKLERWRWHLGNWYYSVPFHMATRAFFGTFIGCLFVFIPKLYFAFPDAPLALIYYIINLTVLVQELQLGIVFQASCLTAVALVFGACFGALGALAARKSVGITIVVAAIGTGLFTMLHSDPRVAGMVYYTGEINFVFNLLDTRTLGNHDIVYTMRITLVASGLSLLLSMIPAILVFPRFSTWDMRICIRDALRNVGTSLSSVSSLLLDPVISIYSVQETEVANSSQLSESHSETSSQRRSFVDSDSIRLDTQFDSYSSPSGSFFATVVDPGKSGWKSNCAYSLKFIESVMEGHHLLAARAQISRARTLASYCSFEPNIAQMFRREPTKLWIRILDVADDLIGKADALRSVVDGGRRKYTSDTLIRWYDMIPMLKDMFAVLSTSYQKIGECICMKRTTEQLQMMYSIREQLLRLEEMEVRLRNSLQRAYLRYWNTTTSLGAQTTALELGPLMFVIILSKAVLESSIHLQEEFVHLISARREKSLRRGYLNLFGWTRSLFWSFETWYRIFTSISLQRSQWVALVHSMEFHYFMKKWIGELVIIIIFLTTPLYRYVANFDGLWVWMSFMIYLTPTVEGTLIGGLITIIGCACGCISGFLLMNWKASAMEPYGLAAVIIVVTTVCVYYMNGPYYVALLTTCTTLYTMILYQYSPVEYKATWHYPLARFINISLGIAIAVVFSEFILPHSALMEARQCLAAALQKMSTWQNWLVSRYWRAVGYRHDQSVVSGTIQVKPLDWGEEAQVLILEENGENDERFLPVNSTSHSSNEEKSVTQVIGEEPSQHKEKTSKPQKDESKGTPEAKPEKDLLDWRTSILQDLKSCASWIQSVQNGVASNLHAIPHTITVALEQENILLSRLVAFSTTIEYEPFLTGRFQYGHYELFVKPLLEELQALQETKKYFIQVIISCIMEGKPFTSLAFLREFGYASARHTASAAWWSKDYFQSTGGKILGPLYEGIHHYAHQEATRAADYAAMGTKEVVKALGKVETGIGQVFHGIGTQLHNVGSSFPSLWPKAFVHSRNEENISKEPSTTPIPIPELGDVFQGDTNDNRWEKPGISLNKEENEASAEHSQRNFVIEENGVALSPAENVPSGSNHSRRLSTRSKISKPASNSSASSQGKSSIWWNSIHHFLNTGTRRFGGASTEVLHTITELILGNEEEEPPIIQNLKQGVQQMRQIQARLYAKYLNLEHVYYATLINQGLQVDTSQAEHQETEDGFHSLYDVPYIRSADDHILFLASFFIVAYVMDGIKSMAIAIADAVMEDIEEIKERHRVLIRKEINKLQKKEKRKQQYHRRGRRRRNQQAE
eukprot:jgi/Galph1/5065/GphlegSOOS_G3694.1